jgi:hypothetical protein
MVIETTMGTTLVRGGTHATRERGGAHDEGSDGVAAVEPEQ